MSDNLQGGCYTMSHTGKRWRLLAAGAVIVAGTGGLAATAGPAAAAPAVPAAATPAVMVCAPNDDGGLCMNRAGGGHGYGTQAISYYYGNENDTFAWYSTPEYCGGGTVTMSCPNWGNSSINAQLDGSPFGEIEDTADGDCLGVNGVETSCGDEFTGSGAGDGAIQVFKGCNRDVGGCGLAEILNNYWTRANGHESWVKISVPAGSKIVMGAPQPWPLAQVYTQVVSFTRPAPGAPGMTQASAGLIA